MRSEKLRHFPEHDPHPIHAKNEERANIERQVMEYLAAGGEIHQADPVEPITFLWTGSNRYRERGNDVKARQRLWVKGRFA